jgi:hypothetical protein
MTIPKAVDVPDDVLRELRQDVRDTMALFERAVTREHGIPREKIEKYEAVEHVLELVHGFLAFPAVAAVRGRTTEISDDEVLAVAFAYKTWAAAANIEQDRARILTGIRIERIRHELETELEIIKKRDDARGRATRFMEETDEKAD